MLARIIGSFIICMSIGQLGIAQRGNVPPPPPPPPPPPTVIDEVVDEPEEYEYNEDDEIEDIDVPSPPPPEAEIDEEVLILVEEMPLFPYDQDSCYDEPEDCSRAAFLEFISANLSYPAIAREAGIEGMCVVSFVVRSNGEITDIELVRGIGAGCDQEALRVIKKMQKEVVWTPGKQKGKPVPVRYNFPIRFNLE